MERGSSRPMEPPSGGARRAPYRRREERWVIVRTRAGEAQARAKVQRAVEKTRQEWTQRLWHLSHQDFACEADALAALERERKELPLWLEVQGQVVAQPRYATRGRPSGTSRPR